MLHCPLSLTFVERLHEKTPISLEVVCVCCIIITEGCVCCLDAVYMISCAVVILSEDRVREKLNFLSQIGGLSLIDD